MMTPKQREADIVSICGRIWARTMKEKAAMASQVGNQKSLSVVYR